MSNAIILRSPYSTQSRKALLDLDSDYNLGHDLWLKRTRFEQLDVGGDPSRAVTGEMELLLQQTDQGPLTLSDPDRYSKSKNFVQPFTEKIVNLFESLEVYSIKSSEVRRTLHRTPMPPEKTFDLIAALVRFGSKIAQASKKLYREMLDYLGGADYSPLFAETSPKLHLLRQSLLDAATYLTPTDYVQPSHDEEEDFFQRNTSIFSIFVGTGVYPTFDLFWTLPDTTHLVKGGYTQAFKVMYLGMVAGFKQIIKYKSNSSRSSTHSSISGLFAELDKVIRDLIEEHHRKEEYFTPARIKELELIRMKEVVYPLEITLAKLLGSPLTRKHNRLVARLGRQVIAANWSTSLYIMCGPRFLGSATTFPVKDDESDNAPFLVWLDSHVKQPTLAELELMLETLVVGMNEIKHDALYRDGCVPALDGSGGAMPGSWV
ncbi:hypothetical protein T439DRAFT_383080 [Meredithblackwellia eburnea MCA 4105]